MTEVIERKQWEEARDITIELYRMLNSSENLHKLMERTTSLLRNWSDCEAVGIRLRDGYDFPYYETNGFPEKHIHMENRLCAVDQNGKLIRDSEGKPVLECMCGNIICGRFDPSKPFFTKHGSFWTNCTTDLLTSTDEEDRQSRTRNTCNREGYESVALIPLRSGSEPYGLIQFNDSRKDMFTTEKIEMFERMADSISSVLAQRRAEEALWKSEASLAEAQRIAHVGNWDWDIVSNELYWSDEIYRIFGLKPQEFGATYEAFLNSVHPDDRDFVTELVNKALEGEAYSIDHRVVLPTGEVRTVHEQGEVTFEEEGKPIRLVGTVEDITERKRAEEALARSETRFRTLIEDSHDLVVLIDETITIKYASPSIAQVLGYQPEELEGQNGLELIHPEDIPVVTEALSIAIETPQERWPVEFRIRHKDGTWRLIEALGNNKLDNPAIGAIVLNGRDITEHRRAEEALIRTNRALRMVSECNQALIREQDEVQLLDAICRIVVDIVGYRLAWVGLAEHDRRKTVRPVSWMGYEKGYLESLNITWADTKRGHGPTGTAIRTGEPVITRDISTDPLLAPWRKEALERGYASSIALPLKIADQAIGALNIYSPEPDAFIGEEVDLLRELGDDLAYGIMALRAKAERRKVEKVQAATYRISEAALAVQSLEQLYRAIHEIVGELMQANNFYIALFDAAAETLSFPYFIDEHDEAPAPKKLGKGLTEYVLRTEKPLLASQEAFDELVKSGEVELIGTPFIDWLGAPLKAHDRTFGAIVVQSYEEGVRYGEKEKNILSFVSSQVAMAISRVRAEEALRDSEERLRIRNEIADIFLTTPGEEMHSEVLHKILEVTESKYGVFGYIDESGALVCPSMTRDIWEQCQVPDKRIVFPRDAWGDSLWCRALREKKPLYSNKLSKVPEGHIPVTRNLAVPIIHEKEVIGLINVANKPSDYDARDVVLLEDIVSHVIAPVLHARILEDQQVKARERAEETLRVSEEYARNIVESSLDMIIVVDNRRRITEFNKAAAKTFGYNPEEVVGKHVNILYADPKEGLKIHKKTVRHGQYVQEILNRRKNGETFPTLLSSSVLRDSSGNKVGVMGVSRDITRRKRAEEALRESEARYRTLVEGSPGYIFLLNREGNILDLDMPRERMAEPGVLVTSHIYDYVNEDDRERFMHEVEACLDMDGLREFEIQNFDLSLTYQVLLAPIKKERGEPETIVSNMYDITERKKLEADILKVEKLESLGVLAGGLAHDFNNLLMGINLNVTTARLKAGQNKELRTLLQSAEDAVMRAKGITQQLLTFTRGGEPVKSKMELAPLLKEAVKFALHGTSVKPRFNIDKKLLAVEIDHGQVNQVINNLVINAVHAMPNGGQVTATATNVIVDEKQPKGPLKPGHYVEVAIQDTGVGIPPNILDSIFDPYFTTREEGSGLGLFSCYSILEKHGGWITVESEVEQGSTFTFYLPAQTDGSGVTTEDEEIIPGSGYLLVVDDEEDIRTGMAELLESLNYEVDTAPDGKTALETYSRQWEAGQPFDLVILDLTLPGGMSGVDIFHHLREINPEVKAVVSSGYATNPIMARYADFGFKGVVIKPFSAEELSMVLSRALGAEDRG